MRGTDLLFFIWSLSFAYISKTANTNKLFTIRIIYFFNYWKLKENTNISDTLFQPTQLSLFTW